MPIGVTYPGVYIEELSSGSLAIAPVATSIAAFVGRTPTGGTDEPVTIFNYGEFTRIFGGLSFDYPLTYSVQDFFANGGSQAIIARLFVPDEGDGIARLNFPPAASADTDSSQALTLQAASPGEWGNRLSATVDTLGVDEASTRPLMAEFGLEPADLFNLTLTLVDETGREVGSERHLYLSVESAGLAGRFSNRIDRVLQGQSSLARVEILPEVPPGDGASAKAAGGNDGRRLSEATYLGDRSRKTGIYLLERARAFNLLCIPPDRRFLPDVPESEQDLPAAVRQAAAAYCADRRAFYIVDPPAAWSRKAKQGQFSPIDPGDVGIAGANAAGIEVGRNAAVYFPRIWKEDVLMESRPALFAPSGAIAGVIAATDVTRGVWKTPAGIEAGLAGVTGLEVDLTDDQNGQLNSLGINCLRKLPVIGLVVWGARTLCGADALEDAYRYLPVRRLTLFVEESLFRGTQWAVFEPNDEALWSSLRLAVSSFLAGLARQGAFYDYSVTCDSTTITQGDMDQGIVNVLVAIAPMKPGEFVVLQIQQVAGGIPS